MNLRTIKMQLAEISKDEDVPEYLTDLSGLFLSLLDTLKGDISDTLFAEMLEDVCKSITDPDIEHKSAPVLDTLLTASYYYRRQSETMFWNRQLYRRYFVLLLIDSYNQIVQLYSDETGIEIECAVPSDTIFDAYVLEGGLTSFSAKKTWRNTIVQFNIIEKYQLLPLDSNLLKAIMQNKDNAFLKIYPVFKYIQRISIGLSLLMGLSMLISSLYLLGRRFIEYPLLMLLNLEGDKNGVSLGEILVQFNSFVKNGFSVFLFHILLSLIGLLIAFGVDYAVKRLSNRIVFNKDKSKNMEINLIKT